MADETAPKKPKCFCRKLWKWTRRVIVVLFLLQVLLIAAALVWAAVESGRGERVLKEAVAECDKRGIAASSDKQFEEEYTSEQKRNGQELMEIVSILGADLELNESVPPLNISSVPKLGEAIPNETAGALERYTSRNGEKLARLKQLSSERTVLPRYSLMDDWSSPMGFARCRAASKYMLALSYFYQSKGQSAKALEACGDALLLSPIASAPPNQLCGLTRVSIDDSICKTIEGTISRLPGDEKAMMDLRQALLKEDAQFDYQEMVKGETSLLLELVVCSDQKYAQDMHSLLVSQMEAYRFESEMRAMIGNEPSPPPQTKTFWQTLKDVFSFALTSDGKESRTCTPVPGMTCVRLSPPTTYNQWRFWFGISWLRHWICPGAYQEYLAKALARDIAEYDMAGRPLTEQAGVALAGTSCNDEDSRASGSVTEHMLRNKASLRLTALGLMLEQYRLDHGAWPESLRDLRATLPEDPFTGKPLLYKRTADGCIVYSVGDDLRDDGGAELSNNKGDIIFHLLDADKRNVPAKVPTTSPGSGGFFGPPPGFGPFTSPAESPVPASAPAP